MKYKKIIALFLAVCCIGAVASCSKTPDSTLTPTGGSSAIATDFSVDIVESTDETDETDEISETEFYSLENMTAAEIKATLEKYYTEIIPSEGQSAETFRAGLPKVPVRLSSGTPSKCFVRYAGLDTEGHSRIIEIDWDGFIKNEDSGNFEIAEDTKSPKTVFALTIKGRDLALELLDLYRQEAEGEEYTQVQDQNEGNIWLLSASGDFVDQIASKVLLVQISPATNEGDDFWTVTVKHSYVR